MCPQRGAQCISISSKKLTVRYVRDLLAGTHKETQALVHREVHF